MRHLRKIAGGVSAQTERADPDMPTAEQTSRKPDINPGPDPLNRNDGANRILLPVDAADVSVRRQTDRHNPPLLENRFFPEHSGNCVLRLLVALMARGLEGGTGINYIVGPVIGKQENTHET